MRAGTLWIALGLGTVGMLAGCAPGPEGYAGFANYRQQQANQHAYAAQRDQQAAQWEAQSGNYYGAQQSQAAANVESNRAAADQAHANRDSFFGNLGF